MADGKYSIDDILNEYSENSDRESKKASDIDIDNILNNYRTFLSATLNPLAMSM